MSDGRIYFHDEGTGGKTKQIVLSVKAGQVTAMNLLYYGDNLPSRCTRHFATQTERQ